MNSGVKVRCYFEARTIGRALDPGERNFLGKVAKGKAHVTMDRLVVDGKMRALPDIDGDALMRHFDIGLFFDGAGPRQLWVPATRAPRSCSKALPSR